MRVTLMHDGLRSTAACARTARAICPGTRSNDYNRRVSAQVAQALQHALMAAARDSANRATAVAALRGAEVWAATWPTDPATLRTLTNSQGVTALAIFTDERQLEDAALRYAWLGVDGRVPSKRLHISEAMRFARQHRAQLVVVDIAADHALELDEGEMELLSASPSGRPPSFTGVQVRSHSSRPPPIADVEVARISTRPQRDSAPISISPGASQSALTPTSVRPDPNTGTVAATFESPTTSTLRALAEPPDEALLDALAQVLKGYPEVEWASFVRSGSVEEAAMPSVALRVNPAFRKNLSEISAKLREAGSGAGTTIDVLSLDTPEQVKQARSLGEPFFPWRKGKR